MRKVGLPGTPWSVKPSQQKSAKPHALCCQAHAKLVPSKALFLPSWPWAPFLVWRKPTLPCQAIAPSTLYIILICEKKTRSPGRERGITRSPGRERGDLGYSWLPPNSGPKKSARCDRLASDAGSARTPPADFQHLGYSWLPPNSGPKKIGAVRPIRF